MSTPRVDRAAAALVEAIVNAVLERLEDVDGGRELLDQWAADDERARLNQGRLPGEH